MITCVEENTMDNIIYLDYAATTPVLQCARDEANRYMTMFYNPSAAYDGAKIVRDAIEEARATIAECIGADPEEIYFTSGATEGNNIIIQGVQKLSPFADFITSEIEHHAVLNLRQDNSYMLHVDSNGLVNPHDLVGALAEGDLVSVMMVNNEIGTIQPIKEISKITNKANAFFHSDITQAVGHIPVNCHELGFDFATASGHKFGAPKGVGFIYIRKGIKLPPLVYGGGQELGLRSGTENTSGIMAMAAALKWATNNMAQNLKRMEKIQRFFINELEKSGFNYSFNHTFTNHYVGNFNICFTGYRAEEIVEFLSSNNIYVSSGSACNTDSGEPSHVLLAIGLTKEQAESSIRVSISNITTEKDITMLVHTLAVYFALRGDVT